MINTHKLEKIDSYNNKENKTKKIKVFGNSKNWIERFVHRFHIYMDNCGEITLRLSKLESRE